MAIHQRQAIREAVRDILLAASTVAEDRVYSARKDPWKPNELPGISVDAIEETSEFASMDGTLSRSLKVAVLAVVSIEERDGDALDAVALEVETALARDSTLGATATSSVLSATSLDLADAAGNPIGAVRLTYDVTYDTPAPV